MIAIEAKINHLDPMLTQEEKRDIQDRINKKMSDLLERMNEYKELTKPIPPSEAIGRVRDQQISTFLASSQKDIETREKAHSVILAISSIEHELTTAIADYEMLNRKKSKENILKQV